MFLADGVTPLTGSGIAIGQFETPRPGKPSPPTNDNAANSHPDVVPAAVYLIDGGVLANEYTGDHSEKVAGVMIANGSGDKGVAPAASLFASAAALGDPAQRYLRSMQHIAPATMVMYVPLT
jgi:hypothetical protein